MENSICRDCIKKRMRLSAHPLLLITNYECPITNLLLTHYPSTSRAVPWLSPRGQSPPCTPHHACRPFLFHCVRARREKRRSSSGRVFRALHPCASTSSYRS